MPVAGCHLKVFSSIKTEPPWLRSEHMEISISVRLVSWAGWQLQSPLSVSCVSLSPRAGGGQETLLRTWQPHQQTSDTLVEEVKRGEWSPHQRSHSSEISVGYNQGPGPPVCLGSNFSVVSPTSRSTYLTPVGPSPLTSALQPGSIWDYWK